MRNAILQSRAHISNTYYDTPTLYTGENGEGLYDTKEIIGRTDKPDIDCSKCIRHVPRSEISVQLP